MADDRTAQSLRRLREVWLKPRRVFRGLATEPIGAIDYLLGAAQGIVSWLALSRAESAGAASPVLEIIGRALAIGPVAGVLGLYLMAAIYSRLARRATANTPPDEMQEPDAARKVDSLRVQVFHVLAYSGVPLLVSLALWLLAALLAGEAVFLQTPRPDTETFLSILLRAQFCAHIGLIAWSLLLQVMGFSEVARLSVRRAFAVWLLGQVLVAFAVFVLAVIANGLLPAGSAQ
jgi:hypothetical protein